MRSPSLLPFAPLLASTLSILASGCNENQTHPIDYAPYDTGAAAPLSCVPNLDGKIESNELPVVFGVTESVLVSPPGSSRSFDRDGIVGADGKRRWAWDQPAADDRVISFGASTVSAAWFASAFPSGQFAAPSDASGRTLAIYEHTDGSVNLLGFASTEVAPPEGKTLIVYTPPVPVYTFPLTVGSQWSATAAVRNGLFRGLPYASNDTYDVSVDVSGEMALPDLTFAQVLRVRTVVTASPLIGMKLVTRQVQFLFECVGEVARATSGANEANDAFTDAAEIRRIGLAPTLR